MYVTIEDAGSQLAQLVDQVNSGEVRICWSGLSFGQDAHILTFYTHTHLLYASSVRRTALTSRYEVMPKA